MGSKSVNARGGVARLSKETPTPAQLPSMTRMHCSRLQLVLFGDSLTQRSFHVGGWGARLAALHEVRHAQSPKRPSRAERRRFEASPEGPWAVVKWSCLAGAAGGAPRMGQPGWRVCAHTPASHVLPPGGSPGMVRLKQIQTLYPPLNFDSVHRAPSGVPTLTGSLAKTVGQRDNDKADATVYAKE